MKTPKIDIDNIRYTNIIIIEYNAVLTFESISNLLYLSSLIMLLFSSLITVATGIPWSSIGIPFGISLSLINVAIGIS